MAKWQKQTLKMAKDHSWQAKPGYQIVVLDRGAVRFDVPRGWGIGPGEGAIELRDKPQPDDNQLLQATILPVPLGADTSGLPLAGLLQDALDNNSEEILNRGLIEEETRPDLELAWRETRFIDPNERREARSRSCLARGGGVHVLLTFSYWPEDARRCELIWKEILRSLRLGEHLDPTTGRPVARFSAN